MFGYTPKNPTCICIHIKKIQTSTGSDIVSPRWMLSNDVAFIQSTIRTFVTYARLKHYSTRCVDI